MKKILPLLCVLFLMVPLFAQERTGNIRGKIVDPDGEPLPGVTVTLKGSQISPTSAVTSAQGMFRFMSLPPAGDYSLTAKLEGFKTLTRGNIEVSVGSSVELTLTMEMGAIEEEVTVTAETPVVESKRTTVDTTMTEDDLQSLPSARDPWVVLQMAPGMMIDREDVGGSQSGQQSGFVAKGGEDSQSVYTMDGLVITDPAAIGASPTYYDFDAFQEMNITTGGADVSVQTGGVAMNLVTKRGSNKLSLGGRFYLTDSKFQSDNMTEELREEGVEGTQRIRNIRDYGFNMGGPLIPDKAWWWMSYGVQNIKTTNLYGNPDDTLLQNYAGKLNFQIVPENRLEIFAHIGNKQKWGRSSSYVVPEGYDQWGKYHFGSPILKIQDEHMFGENLFVSVKYGYSDAGFNYAAHVDPNSQKLSMWNISNYQYQNSYGAYRASRPVHQFDATANYFNDDLLGASHEFKLGVEYADRTGSHSWKYPGNTMWYVNYGGYTTVDVTGDNVPDVVPGITRVNVWRGWEDNNKVKAFSVYGQDTISVGRLNFLVGLRYDIQQPMVNKFTREAVVKDHPVWNEYYSDTVTDAIQNVLPGSQIPQINPDYAWKVFSPRIGVTYDVFGTGKTVLKLNLAKYGDFMGTGEASYFMKRGTGGWMDFWWQDQNDNGVVNATELYWRTAQDYSLTQVFDNEGNFIAEDILPNAEGVMWGGYDFQNPQELSGSQYTMGPNVGSTNTWEAIFTVSQEVLPDFGVSADITYRRYDHFHWNLDYDPETGNKQSQDEYTQVGTIPDQTGPYDTDEASDKPYYLQESDVPYRWYQYREVRPDRYNEYYGLTVRANKRLSNNWMFRGSFTLQNQARHYGDEGYLNPTNIWALDGKPYAEYMGGASGKVSQYVFSNWLFKLSGMYQFPWDINASFTFHARQGYVLRERVEIVDYNAPNPRNQSIWAWLNPFGTHRLPTFMNGNLRVEKMLSVGDVGKIYIMADVFNPLNLNTLNRRYQKDHGTYYVHSGEFVQKANDGRPNAILNPRVLRLGVRFKF
ncbi:TonB-dependent receptor [bacterium]|nr:TonB-dependent receptor [bacterium]